MTSRICQTSDSEQIQGRLRKRRGGADARVAFAILATVVGVLLTVAIIGRGGDPTIDESADALSLKAWGYSAEIPYSAIDSVGLRHGLDGLRGRRNGLQSGNSYAGRFAMEPYGDAMLFVNALREPLVVIFANSGVTIVSAADSIAAETLAARLRSAASRTRAR